jgi:catechol 2,3-dioxygenase-like lactoylglutathione lyase family enzyme
VSQSPTISLASVVLGTPDPRSLAEFYRRLLGWEIADDQPGWVVLRPPDHGTGLSFQLEADHVPPVWPPKPAEQQMMMHLDVRVDDLESASSNAESLGATLADYQPQDDVRVYLDPAGHPFCLFEPGT